MSKISKEKWEEIEQVLQGYFADVCFTYKGYELAIQRSAVGEGRTALFVYIDGVIKGSWNLQKDDTPQIVPEVWRRRTMSVYSPKERKEIERALGKRQAKKDFPKLHDKVEWYDAMFTKASVLVRQFKKLEGIELSEKSSEYITSDF